MRPKIYKEIIVTKGDEKYTFSNVTKLSKALNVSQSAIYQCIKKGTYNIKGWDIHPIEMEYAICINK